MDSAPSIVHEAVVIRVLPQEAELEVAVSDGKSDSCSSCAAAVLCKRSGGRLRVRVRHPERYSPGQRVQIGAGGSMHRRAVALLLGVPCLMLVLPMLALLLLGQREITALVAGITACGLTYLVLWLCRGRVNGGQQFTVLDK